MQLIQLVVKGFKSIHPDGQLINFGDVTVLLGPNGAGKSNLVSFLKMLNFIAREELQIFIGKQGGADALLHYGSKHTDAIEFSLILKQEAENTILSTYSVSLTHGMPDKLFIAREQVTRQQVGEKTGQKYFLDNGNSESGLFKDRRTTSKILLSALGSIRTYQFHDTSDTSRIRANGYIDDSRYLRSDAGNLAAFLKMMKTGPKTKRYYERIVHHIQRVMPQFGDFDLETITGNDLYVRLNWKDISNDFLFGPHQISDGTLRFMALASLLLQPPTILPDTIVLDEPELGLHPAAIAELAGMIRMASKNARIVVATQSTRLVDEFNAGEIVVVERDEMRDCSVFKRLNETELGDWLSRYSLSELWEKNVLGGLP
ncbi:MAG: AAA family ATPase [Deltaproteobacteria bacterium]|nr:AAA family ATPase [Deltaproteobacteria bacterium]